MIDVHKLTQVKSLKMFQEPNKKLKYLQISKGNKTLNKVES